MDIPTKICTACQEEKPLQSFNKHKNRADGLQTNCRKCNKERCRKYYKDNCEEHKLYVREHKDKNTAQYRRLKVCKICFQQQPIYKFGKDGLCRTCKGCKLEQKNESVRKTLREKRNFINSCKKQCCVCFEDDVDILVFHHVRDKKFTISLAAGQHIPYEIIIEEIKKCVVLCAHCHTKYHKKRFSFLWDKPEN